MNWNQQTKYLLLCFEVSKWCCLELSIISLPCLVKLLEFWNGGECSTWRTPCWRAKSTIPFVVLWSLRNLTTDCILQGEIRQIVFWKGKLVLGWSRWTHKIRVAFWVTIEIKSLIVLCAYCSGNVNCLVTFWCCWSASCWCCSFYEVNLSFVRLVVCCCSSA